MTQEARHVTGVETEYKIMRDEILARISLRQQIVAVTLTLGGVFLGVGISQPTVALVYPPLAAFLALAWAQNDYRVRDIGRYIRSSVEPALEGARWESYINSQRGGTKLGSWRFVVLGHGGLFLFTQVAATFIGSQEWIRTAIASPRSVPVVAATLAVVDLFAIGLVCWVVAQSGRLDSDAHLVETSRREVEQPANPAMEPSAH
jgi:hypothetical protein